MPTLVTEAIHAALKADWDNAISLNKKLLKENATDIETLNRLAYALLEKGELDEARKVYQKVLKLDKHNPIAEKNVRKLSVLQGKTIIQSSKKFVDGESQTTRDLYDIFLEEPGKTKITKLRNVAEVHILSALRPADEISLSVKRHTIVVKSIKGDAYIGALPDDLTHRLIPLLKAGNVYKAYIKSVEKNAVSILIKEAKRGNRFKNTPSFLTTPASYYSFVREDAIKEERRPDVSTYEELEEESSDKQEEAES